MIYKFKHQNKNKLINKRRYKKTLTMLDKISTSNNVIFDLGVENPLSILMKKKGYRVFNTSGQDLDNDYNISLPKNVDLITGFEILEHLVSPYPLLKNLNANKLFVTVPLKLWYSKAYKNENDIRDRHYHEFEDWQFDWLLEKAGWKIKRKEYWTNPVFKIGFRPFLRLFSKRYYAVYAERQK